MPIHDKISKEDLANYKARKLTARYLSEKYGYNLFYIYQSVPRDPKPNPQNKPKKSTLNQARREFRDSIARQVPPYSAKEAAKICHCCERTMWRHIKKVREVK